MRLRSENDPKGLDEQLYGNRLDNVEEMDEFPETCNLPKWKEEAECLERLNNNMCRCCNKHRN